MAMAQFLWVIVALGIIFLLELILWILLLVFKCSTCIDQDGDVLAGPLANGSVTLAPSASPSKSSSSGTTARVSAPASTSKSCLPCQRQSWPIQKTLPASASSSFTPASSSNGPNTDACPSPNDTNCGSSVGCVDLSTHSSHCGSCFKECAVGERCVGGHCESTVA